jgi:RNA polymerase sigma-70 factor (ECF subfamily)
MHRPPTDEPRSPAVTLLFRSKVFREVLSWLERLEIPDRDRDDVAGEIWLSAWLGWHAFDPERTAPKRWLSRIAVHAALHYHERALRRREIPLDEPLEVPDPAPDALQLLIAEETRLGVLEAIDTLDLHERELLVGHDIDGVPLHELAERLGIPVLTAHQRRARAMAALRAEIERRDADNT